MSIRKPARTRKRHEPPVSIRTPSWIEVGGYKSIRQPVRIEMRPLTLLAGTNSSGKSSALQPLLLLKQSLEVPYDPDPLLLDGPHVAFTSLDQILSRGRRKDSRSDQFYVAFGPRGTKRLREFLPPPLDVKLAFARASAGRERLELQIYVREPGAERWIRMFPEERSQILAAFGIEDRDVEVKTSRRNLSLYIQISRRRGEHVLRWYRVPNSFDWVRSILHLPGHRGHRERRYPITKTKRAEHGAFSLVGPMHPYAASLLLGWQGASADGSMPEDWKERAEENIERVNRHMKTLGLTWKVLAKPANAAELELRVGRMPTAQQGGAKDLVDIADVGFGASQVLPVLVALSAAVPGQMVFVEQPELHLHPRAQLALGGVLVEAAKRGVFVVIETHSHLVLRAIQTKVASGDLKPEEVGLHWFTRDPETGWTSVVRAQVERDGSFGDWPVDFPDVFAMADRDFIDAVFGQGGAR